jgi:hypothetical protein
MPTPPVRGLVIPLPAEATSSLALLMWLLIEPETFITERKVLRITRLAEQLRRSALLEETRARKEQVTEGGAV